MWQGKRVRSTERKQFPLCPDWQGRIQDIEAQLRCLVGSNKSGISGTSVPYGRVAK